MQQASDLEKMARKLAELEALNNQLYYGLKDFRHQFDALKQALEGADHKTADEVLALRSRVEGLLAELEEAKKAVLAAQRAPAEPELEIKPGVVQESKAEPLVETKPAADPIPAPEVVQPEPEVLKPVAERSIPVMQAVPDPKPVVADPAPKSVPKSEANSARNLQLESFIGGNLINKIGILITIVGVAIGSKYAIDHDLISPAMRIILGYGVGGGLLFVALRLKKKYPDYSAVLLGGSVAIFYFLTYFSYVLYHFFSVELTFGLMLLFTAFTVYQAIRYDKQLIALYGLIGAYGIPFLLSDGSGRIGFFYSYLVLINAGILVISYLRNWKALRYISFAFTWAIYLIWFNIAFRDHEHFTYAFLFAVLFFLLFYATGFIFKLIRNQAYDPDEMTIILINSFVFYGVGYLLLEDHLNLDRFTGLFTLCNGAVHGAFAMVLHRRKLADKTLYYLALGLALLFLTISIPIQLDGNAITVVWVAEAVMLFAIGRYKGIRFFERMSQPVLGISFVSLLWFWIDALWLDADPDRVYFFNGTFLTSLFAAAGYMAYRVIHRRTLTPGSQQQDETSVLDAVLVVLILFTTYLPAFTEIYAFWGQQRDAHLHATLGFSESYKLIGGFRSISLIGFTMLYLSGLLFWRLRKQENNSVFVFFSALAGMLTWVFMLTEGLYTLNMFHLQYLAEYPNAYYHGAGLILIRYLFYGVSLAFVLIFLRWIRKYYTNDFMKQFIPFVLHLTILWGLSAELVNWLHFFHSRQVYKTGLSILWGLYALYLIVIGFRFKKQVLRILAIGLFGITLLKLFFYDLVHLSNIHKTVVFIALGVLLLIISFLYNKYKYLLVDEPEGGKAAPDDEG